MMKIRYLFPKLHHTEAAIRIFKLMWYRTNFPKEYAMALKERTHKRPKKESEYYEIGPNGNLE